MKEFVIGFVSFLCGAMCCTVIVYGAAMWYFKDTYR